MKKTLPFEFRFVSFIDYGCLQNCDLQYWSKVIDILIQCLSVCSLIHHPVKIVGF